MSRRWKDPLRPLTADERIALTHLSRSPSAPAAQVERARALLAIADGASYTAAAHQVRRRHTQTISAWVSRFNREGLAAVRPGHGGGARIRYGADAQQRILAEWARAPQREQDGTATWSLRLLQKALRQADDGLARVSTFTMWRILHEAGLSWQNSRTWCETGVGMRPRKHAGAVRVSDPDARAKKADRAGLHAWRAAWALGVVRG
jgi:transposase